MTLRTGDRLGPYEIILPLGAGGMGEVYKAKDTRLGREVAIRVLPAHLSAIAEVRARFEREGRAISQLNHPHICSLHDIGHQDGIDYLRKTTLTSELASLQGLAWSQGGREIWFSAQAKSIRRDLFAVTLEGRLRSIARFPSSIVLYDLAPDGRALLASERSQTGIRGRSSADDKERELGWLDFPWRRNCWISRTRLARSSPACWPISWRFPVIPLKTSPRSSAWHS